MIPQRMAVVDKTLKYKETDEHFLRRLASALVLQWDELSNDLQDLVIDQAGVVLDRQDAPHAREDIENFLRTVKSAPSKAKAAPEPGAG